MKDMRIDIKKNAFAIIRVEKRSYKEKKFIDLREYYQDDDDEFQPTKKGIMILI